MQASKPMVAADFETRGGTLESNLVTGSSVKPPPLGWGYERELENACVLLVARTCLTLSDGTEVENPRFLRQYAKNLRQHSAYYRVKSKAVAIATEHVSEWPRSTNAWPTCAAISVIH
jgi:hypothetical protein